MNLGTHLTWTKIESEDEEGEEGELEDGDASPAKRSRDGTGNSISWGKAKVRSQRRSQEKRILLDSWFEN